VILKGNTVCPLEYTKYRAWIDELKKYFTDEDYYAPFIG
jgi:hypothetical protein